MEFSSFDEMESAANFDWLWGKASRSETKLQVHSQSMVIPSVFDDSEVGLNCENEQDNCYSENCSQIQDSADDDSADCSEQQKFCRKRDQKHHGKQLEQQESSDLNSGDNKIEKRKLQNRLAAQKSRDRKKLKMEVIEEENISLWSENLKLKQTLQNYLEQLDKLKQSIDELLCKEWITKFQCKIKLHSAKQQREIIQNINNLGKNNNYYLREFLLILI